MMTSPASSEPATRKPRSTWPKRFGFGLVIVILYVASIGPWAGLEAHGYGSEGFWRGVKPAYFPIYWSWKYGPEWWADALGDYTALFHHPQSWLFKRNSFASPNNADGYRDAKDFLKLSGMSEQQMEQELRLFDW